ncbi:hypothetical protein H3C70_01030 [Patescibacteria group bacterium]|nr:hypothetical protein [Patescibacteria group bacterium]
MGFKININNILRSDFDGPLQEGTEYSFQKELSVMADDIQIWLTKKDWTAVAEIQITSQTRKDDKTIGTFVVKYLYSPEESAALTKIFRRMYGWE